MSHWHSVLPDAGAVAMLETASTIERKYLAQGPFWTGLARMACFLPTSQLVTVRTAAVFAKWTLTYSVLHEYSINQHSTPSLLLCSPDCIIFPMHSLHIKRTWQQPPVYELLRTRWQDQLSEQRWKPADPLIPEFQHPSATLSTCKTRWLWHGNQVFNKAHVT